MPPAASSVSASLLASFLVNVMEFQGVIEKETSVTSDKAKAVPLLHKKTHFTSDTMHSYRKCTTLKAFFQLPTLKFTNKL